MAERTGCPVLLNLWSYVIYNGVVSVYIVAKLRSENGGSKSYDSKYLLVVTCTNTILPISSFPMEDI
jgi:hypothetical protein